MLPVSASGKRTAAAVPESSPWWQFMLPPAQQWSGDEIDVCEAGHSHSVLSQHGARFQRYLALRYI